MDSIPRQHQLPEDFTRWIILMFFSIPAWTFFWETSAEVLMDDATLTEGRCPIYTSMLGESDPQWLVDSRGFRIPLATPGLRMFFSVSSVLFLPFHQTMDPFDVSGPALLCPWTTRIASMPVTGLARIHPQLGYKVVPSEMLLCYISCLSNKESRETAH